MGKTHPQCGWCLPTGTWGHKEVWGKGNTHLPGTVPSPMRASVTDNSVPHWHQTTASSVFSCWPNASGPLRAFWVFTTRPHPASWILLLPSTYPLLNCLYHLHHHHHHQKTSHFITYRHSFYLVPWVGQYPHASKFACVPTLYFVENSFQMDGSPKQKKQLFKTGNMGLNHHLGLGSGFSDITHVKVLKENTTHCQNVSTHRNRKQIHSLGSYYL